MKYKVVYDLSKFYTKYLDGSSNFREFLRLRKRTIDKEITDKMQTKLSEIFLETDNLLICLFGLELGFLNEIINNDYAMNHFSLYKLGFVRHDILSRFLYVDAISRISINCIREVESGIFFMSEIQKIPLEIREPWINNAESAVFDFCFEEYSSPYNFDAYYLAELLNHSECNVIFDIAKNHGTLANLIEENKDEISEIHENSGRENSDVPIEILARLNGLMV